MDGQSFARVDDVSEDFEDLRLDVDALRDQLEGVTDSVSFLLMADEQTFWELDQ